MDRIYLSEAFIRPLKAVMLDGTLLEQNYLYQSLESYWEHCVGAAWIIFLFNGVFHIMNTATVKVDEKARTFTDDYLTFKQEASAITAAFLASSLS